MSCSHGFFVHIYNPKMLYNRKYDNFSFRKKKCYKNIFSIEIDSEMTVERIRSRCF